MFARSGDRDGEKGQPFVEHSLGHLDERLLDDIGIARRGWAGDRYVAAGSTQRTRGLPFFGTLLGLVAVAVLMRR